MIRYGEPATMEAHDFYLRGKGDHHVTIKPGDKHFHRSGTYYIMVVPAPNLWQKLFADDWFNYAVKFSFRGGFDFISANTLHKQRQDADTVKLFKYIVTDPHQDLRIQVNSHEGPVF